MELFRLYYGHLVGEDGPRPDEFGGEIDEEMEVHSACLISVFKQVLDGHQCGAQPPAHPSVWCAAGVSLGRASNRGRQGPALNVDAAVVSVFCPSVAHS